MDFQELLRWIDTEDVRLTKHFGNPSEKEKILARTVKLTEELGELCGEVLAARGDQRKEKLAQRNNDNLPDEFADVIITTFLLAKTMNVDVVTALREKIEKINARYNA